MKKPVLIYIIAAISILVAIGAIVFSILTIISAYKPLEYVDTRAATCTEQGNVAYYKNPKNGLIYSDNKGEHELEPKDVILPATGHKENSGETTKAATCTDAGTKTYKCGVCGEITRTETIPATGHDMVYIEAQKPTDTQDGNRAYYYCKRCKNKYDDKLGLKQLSQVAIPAYNTRGLEYQILNERFCSVKIIDDAPSEVTIDAIYEHDGISYTVQKIIADDADGNHDKVTSIELPNTVEDIEANAFKGFSNLASITFGDNSQLFSIGEGAFEGCTRLKNVAIPESVTSIGVSAFDDCISLQSITVDENNVYYSSQDGILYNKAKTEFINIPKAINVAVIPVSITTIGEGVFEGCTSLTDITIPDSVTSIGSSAFSGCINLASISVPFVGNGLDKTHFGYIFGASEYSDNFNTVPASLKKVVITGGTSIESNAFDGCSNITNITIPAQVTSIGSSSFSGCTSLESITIPASVTSIGSSSFSGCTSLESITIPDTVTSIGSYAFSGCSGLTGVYISDLTAWCNIEFGGSSANPLTYAHNLYINNNNVTEITADMLQSVEQIREYAFYNCESITSITIPYSVTSIGSSAFSGCINLASISVPFVGNGLDKTHFGYIFGASEYSDNFNTVPASLKKVVITGGTSIESNAFDGCSNITNITIPAQVTSIGSSSFSGCTSLESITIPDTVTSIGSYAFSGCSGLTGVYISDLTAWCNIEFGGSSANPLTYAHNLYINNNNVTEITADMLQSVEQIREYAFYNCESITSITIPESVTSIGSSAFSGCSNLESITLPFVGNGTDKTHFGYIFGASSYWSNSSYVPASLKTVVITGGTSIESYAFYNCNIESITLPFVGNGTDKTHFGYIFGASSYWSNSSYVPASLKKVVITGGTSIESYAFRDCKNIESITIPAGVTSIGKHAFDDCTAEIKWGDDPTISEIGEFAFSGYQGTSITIPTGVTSISMWAFDDCTAEIKWGDDPTISEIGGFAFSGYQGTSITIPASVTSISSLAFDGCTSLESIEVDINNTKYSSPEGVLYNKDKTELIKCPATKTSVIILNSVKSIGKHAFDDCAAEIKWGDNPTISEIGGFAFSGYQGTSITIPTGVTAIGDWAFSDCTSLTSITIPAGVTSIGYEAFRGCTRLKEVVFRNATGWQVSESFNMSDAQSVTVTDSSQNVTLLTQTYVNYYWKREQN